MPERRNKPGKGNLVELDTEEVAFILEPAQVEVGSGYTVAVDYDEDGKQVIDVKTYGEVDTVKIRREIQKMFPEAQIRKLNPNSSVTVVKKRRIKRPSKQK
jgi:hypothetical protein